MMADEVQRFGNVKAWLGRVGARPAVQAGMAVPHVG
jgi:glutathione S-transferase